MCQGQKMTYQDIMPPWMQSLQQGYAGFLQGKQGKGGTAYPGQLNAPFDQNQLQANNLISMMMTGKAYKPPAVQTNSPYGTYGGDPNMKFHPIDDGNYTPIPPGPGPSPLPPGPTPPGPGPSPLPPDPGPPGPPGPDRRNPFPRHGRTGDMSDQGGDIMSILDAINSMYSSQ
jgi:hypothetical protein